jgi:chromosome segregation ATPase
MNTDFYILIGLFLSLTFLITIIIVFFVTKIRSLNSILEQAKEIDEAKIAKIKRLEEELAIQTKRSNDLSQELKFLPKNKQRLDEALEYIDKLKEQMARESRENVKKLNKQKLDYEQLRVHYELLNKSYIKLGERYKRVKDRNDELIEENNNFYKRLREMEVRVNEHIKRI